MFIATPRSIVALALLNDVQDAKVFATETDWLGRSITLTQRLAENGFDSQADAMRTTGTLDAFRVVCAESALALYHVAADVPAV